ncbi:putative Lipase [Taphrina deformans PYCC 5710]|uniref:Lipase n=1 Tax=Taphrina deformans (strain PYCC 5710 / ATCC 11124 / CBS 356.35 / IMI 108563 / JCM 9778 / NBRC 8474) TaxID=1097556 RepID=R4X8K0_TAPDE|nr:putative Lipase [Taphrina deformans PYCC 5710]|eukprot:CCG81938.1 putative Lipase [Taphrina deformans PYCC 5710]
MQFFTIILLLGHVLAAPLKSIDGTTVTSQQYADLVRNARFAAAAYTDQCSRPPNGAVLVQEIVDPLTDTQGYVARADDTKEIIVALRGSSSVVDFLTDAETSLVPCSSPGVPYPSPARCHSGFQDSWNAVQPKFLEAVTQQVQSHPGYTITVVGHSLGGGLASQAALSMVYNLPGSVITGFSFGQPRTGDVNYANFHDAALTLRQGQPSFHRSVHTTDGVPQVIRQGSTGSPVSTLAGLVLLPNNPWATTGYRHHGTEVWQYVDPASQMGTVQCAGQEDATCQDSVYIFAPLFGINLEHTRYYGVDFANTGPQCAG